MKTSTKMANLPGIYYTKLKFVKSEKTGNYIGFVSKNKKTGLLAGVRENDSKPKKVCVIDKKSVTEEIIPNALYNVSLRTMASNNGFVVIEATPVKFKAVIEVSYIPKALYTVEIKFGNKIICFDPKDGRKASCKTLTGCLELLEKRIDIENQEQILEDFKQCAEHLLEKYYGDGFI